MNIIKHEVIGSSAIKSFEYEIETKILRIHFIHGGTYDYPDMPLLVVQKWMKADSAGKFFNQNIRQYGG